MIAISLLARCIFRESGVHVCRFLIRIGLFILFPQVCFGWLETGHDSQRVDIISLALQSLPIDEATLSGIMPVPLPSLVKQQEKNKNPDSFLKVSEHESSGLWLKRTKSACSLDGECQSLWFLVVPVAHKSQKPLAPYPMVELPYTHNQEKAYLLSIKSPDEIQVFAIPRVFLQQDQLFTAVNIHLLGDLDEWVAPRPDINPKPDRSGLLLHYDDDDEYIHYLQLKYSKVWNIVKAVNYRGEVVYIIILSDGRVITVKQKNLLEELQNNRIQSRSCTTRDICDKSCDKRVRKTPGGDSKRQSHDSKEQTTSSGTSSGTSSDSQQNTGSGNSAKTAQDSSPILSLPPELITKIMDILPFPAIKRMGDTCRKLRQICEHYPLLFLKLLSHHYFRSSPGNDWQLLSGFGQHQINHILRGVAQQNIPSSPRRQESTKAMDPGLHGDDDEINLSATSLKDHSLLEELLAHEDFQSFLKNLHLPGNGEVTMKNLRACVKDPVYAAAVVRMMMDLKIVGYRLVKTLNYGMEGLPRKYVGRDKVFLYELPNNRLIYSLGGRICIWSLPSGEIEHIHDFDQNIFCLCMMPDGQCVLLLELQLMTWSPETKCETNCFDLMSIIPENHFIPEFRVDRIYPLSASRVAIILKDRRKDIEKVGIFDLHVGKLLWVSEGSTRQAIIASLRNSKNLFVLSHGMLTWGHEENLPSGAEAPDWQAVNLPIPENLDHPKVLGEQEKFTALQVLVLKSCIVFFYCSEASLSARLPDYPGFLTIWNEENNLFRFPPVKVKSANADIKVLTNGYLLISFCARSTKSIWNPETLQCLRTFDVRSTAHSCHFLFGSNFSLSLPNCLFLSQSDLRQFDLRCYETDQIIPLSEFDRRSGVFNIGGSGRIIVESCYGRVEVWDIKKLK